MHFSEFVGFSVLKSWNQEKYKKEFYSFVINQILETKNKLDILDFCICINANLPNVCYINSLLFLTFLFSLLSPAHEMGVFLFVVWFYKVSKIFKPSTRLEGN